MSPCYTYHVMTHRFIISSFKSNNMNENLCMRAPVRRIIREAIALSPKYFVSPLERFIQDKEKISELVLLYAGVHKKEKNIARVEIDCAIRGEYGSLLPRSSFLALKEGRIVAVALSVHRAPWPGTPDCPFVIDLFTDENNRREGLAKKLIVNVARSLDDQKYLGLCVDNTNTIAKNLYKQLGFRKYSPS